MDVGVGVVVTIIGSVLLWGKRMAKLENRFISLEAKVTVLDGNMGARFSSLDSKIDGRMCKLETQVGFLPEQIGMQVKTVADSVDRLTLVSKNVHAEFAKHFGECERFVIGPLKEQLQKVAEKVFA